MVLATRQSQFLGSKYAPSFDSFFLFLVFFILTTAPAFASADEDKIFVGVILGGLALSGLVLFFRGFGALRRKRLMEDTPTSTIRAIAPGQVEVAGLPVEWKLLTAPFSLKSCVFYSVSVSEQRERRVTDKDGKTRTEHYWVTLYSADTSETPFFLDDGTGKLMVKPEGAEIILKDHFRTNAYSWGGTPDHIRRYLADHDVSPASGNPRTYTEQSFRPGHPLYALGVYQGCQGQKGGPEGATLDRCLAKGKEGETFILSAKGQKALTSALGWKAFFGIFFGILLLAGAVYFWKMFGDVFSRGY